MSKAWQQLNDVERRNIVDAALGTGTPVAVYVAHLNAMDSRDGAVIDTDPKLAAMRGEIERVETIVAGMKAAYGAEIVTRFESDIGRDARVERELGEQAVSWIVALLAIVRPPPATQYDPSSVVVMIGAKRGDLAVEVGVDGTHPRFTHGRSDAGPFLGRADGFDVWLRGAGVLVVDDAVYSDRRADDCTWSREDFARWNNRGTWREKAIALLDKYEAGGTALAITAKPPKWERLGFVQSAHGKVTVARVGPRLSLALRGEAHAFSKTIAVTEARRGTDTERAAAALWDKSREQRGAA